MENKRCGICPRFHAIDLEIKIQKETEDRPGKSSSSKTFIMGQLGRMLQRRF